jgi:hypothetical protein
VSSNKKGPWQSDEEEIIGEDVEKRCGLEPLGIRVHQSVEVTSVMESTNDESGDDAGTEKGLVLSPRCSSESGSGI